MSASHREFAEKARRKIASWQSQMKVGMRCTVERDDFEAAFPPMDYNDSHWTSADRFMSQQMGSAFGTWRCWQSTETGNYTIERGEEGPEMVWKSPDHDVRLEGLRRSRAARSNDNG